MIEFAIGLAVGLGLGWYQFRPVKKQRGLRTVRYDYTPPVAVEAQADEEQWTTYLAAFGLQCAFLKSPSERAVLEAGIVEGTTDYRQFARVLRQCGVWSDRGPRYKTRWRDHLRRRAVAQLRHAILTGRVRPRWPAPTPPPVYAVWDAHAPRFADRADARSHADGGTA